MSSPIVKVIVIKTDNKQDVYCVQFHESKDNGANYYLTSCRYYSTKREVDLFLAEINCDTEIE